MNSYNAHFFYNGKYGVYKILEENSLILDIVDADSEPEYVAVGGFVNAHTHVGDSFIDLPPKLDVASLVGPGGYKHRILNSVDEKTMIKGIKESIKTMKREKVRAFFDFREGGVKGLEIINKIKIEGIEKVILSRPKDIDFSKEEMDFLLKNSNGIGLSSISDYPIDFIKKVASYTKENGKIFAIHVSERVREDIDTVLDLNPDFIVHMHKANENDLEKVKRKNIVVVVCPRSSLFFNIIPDIKRLVDFGIEWALGTDNGMISIPSIRLEMEYVYRISGIDPLEIIKAGTIRMDRFLNKPERIFIFKGNPSKIVKNPFINPFKVLKINDTVWKLHP